MELFNEIVKKCFCPMNSANTVFISKQLISVSPANTNLILVPKRSRSFMAIRKTEDGISNDLFLEGCKSARCPLFLQTLSGNESDEESIRTKFRPWQRIFNPMKNLPRGRSWILYLGNPPSTLTTYLLEQRSNRTNIQVKDLENADLASQSIRRASIFVFRALRRLLGYKLKMDGISLRNDAWIGKKRHLKPI
jgi:hypothetical protein